MLTFPYGFSDFYLLRTENYFYVDRSFHIRLIENAGINCFSCARAVLGKVCCYQC